jgi:hypothetical protein
MEKERFLVFAGQYCGLEELLGFSEFCFGSEKGFQTPNSKNEKWVLCEFIFVEFRFSKQLSCKFNFVHPSIQTWPQKRPNIPTKAKLEIIIWEYFMSSEKSASCFPTSPSKQCEFIYIFVYLNMERKYDMEHKYGHKYET